MKLTLNRDLGQKLELLKNKKEAPKLSELAKELQLEVSEVVDLLREELFDDEERYSLSMTPKEWVGLYKILTEKNKVDVETKEFFKSKILLNGPIKVVMDLLSQLEQWDQEANEVVGTLVKNLEPLIKNSKAISFETISGEERSVIPLRIIHLEGELTLIGEDTEDHSLSIHPIKTFECFKERNEVFAKEASHFEIEEFIAAIRKMNEKETRLILKIHEPQAVNVYPEHHFLGKPCMVNNQKGDLIWAAYVEPCDALFEWLLALGVKVEILDPTSFKEKFLEYCREKMRKIA